MDHDACVPGSPHRDAADFPRPRPRADSPAPPSPTFEPTNGVAHPVLSALGDRGAWARPQQQTEDWTHSAPFGVSPPKRQPAPLEPAQATPPSIPVSPPQQAPEDFRGDFSNMSPATSPRLGHRFPARSPTVDYPAFGSAQGGSGGATPRGRPVSMPAQYYQGLAGPASTQHTLQAARYHSRSSSRKPANYDLYAFDTLPSSNDDLSTAGTPALLISAHQTLYAYEVAAESLKYYGHIEGLRGRVLSAKIIPVSMRHDKLRSLRPLVAVIVHGPYIPQHSDVFDESLAQSQHSEIDPSESVMQAMQTAHQGPASETQFQTTVEVYSLKERQHVATLFRSPIVDAAQLPGERFIEPPPAVGALSIYVNGRFVVVASATSGEVYIHAAARDNSEAAFRCIGKTWTATPTPTRKSRTWSTSSASAAEAEGAAEGSALVELPILSLSHRWLAVRPPPAGSKTTLHGSVDLVRGERSPPGLESTAPASQPSATCELDTPLEDSRLNRVARDVAQEVLKGAQWVGAQGMQAWKSYWSKPTDQPSPQENPRSPRTAAFPAAQAGDDGSRASQGATLVSILDLERLSESQGSKSGSALQPMATFPLPDGCSHLSFSPSGLNLLTASTKGDVQYVWDLMRMAYPRTETFATTTTIAGPLVRQVARFTRVTQAHILEVVWSEPRGERLAILTDRGTVHLHDVPASAYTWPPPRAKRTAPAKPAPEAAAPAGGWGATLSSMTGRAQPILTAARDTRMPSLGGLGIGSNAGRQGSKMVATGFSKSVGAATGTMNSLRHMGESRLSVPVSSARFVAPGSLRWLAQRDGPVIVAVVGDRKLQLFSVVSKPDPRSKTGRRYAAVGMRLAEHALPALKDPEARLPRDGILLGGWWPATAANTRTGGHGQRGIRALRNAPAPLSHAELESCAPFQPVHADRRVTLKTFDRHADLGGGGDWAFGGPLPAHAIVSSPGSAAALAADSSHHGLDFAPRRGGHDAVDDEEDDEPALGQFGFPDDDSDDETQDLLGLGRGLGIASIIRHEGEMRADGAGPASVTVQARPVAKKASKSKKKKAGAAAADHGRKEEDDAPRQGDTARDIIEAAAYSQGSGASEGHEARGAVADEADAMQVEREAAKRRLKRATQKEKERVLNDRDERRKEEEGEDLLG